MKNSVNPFRLGSKSYEIAQMFIENKSFDEIVESLPGVAKKTVYNVRSKLKRKGLLGRKQKKVVPPQRKQDEAPSEDRRGAVHKIWGEKPGEKRVAKIEAMAKNLGWTSKELETLIEVTKESQIAQELAKIPQKKREKPIITNGSLRTVPTVHSGSHLKVPITGDSKESISPIMPPLQTPPKMVEGDGEEDLATVILRILNERDQRMQEAAEEQMRMNEEEKRKALEIVAKQYNIKPENIPKLLNRQPSDVSDSQKVSALFEEMPPEQLRLLLKKRMGMTEKAMLTAFKYMDTGASLVDIMDELNLDFNMAFGLQMKYNQLKKLELESQQLDEPQLKAWFDVSKVIGENMRRNCTYYKEASGICEFWKVHDISKQYRETFKGLYARVKDKVGGYFINVNNHPEICAICGMGTLKMRGLET